MTRCREINDRRQGVGGKPWWLLPPLHPRCQQREAARRALASPNSHDLALHCKQAAGRFAEGRNRVRSQKRHPSQKLLPAHLVVLKAHGCCYETPIALSRVPNLPAPCKCDTAAVWRQDRSKERLSSTTERCHARDGSCRPCMAASVSWRGWPSAVSSHPGGLAKGTSSSAQPRVSCFCVCI